MKQLIKNFFQSVRNANYIGDLRDGNRKSRRQAKRIAKTLKRI